MSFKAEEATFQSPLDKLDLFARRWVPEVTKAVVILAHGYQEHSGRYERIAGPLCEKGVAVYAMDHRGHGKSGLIDKKRGYFKSFDNLVKDFAYYVSQVYAAYGQSADTPDFGKLLQSTGNPVPVPADATAVVPMFIMGHSMGSLIATNYAVLHPQKPFAGLVLSSPFFMLSKEPNFIVVAAGKLAAYIMPHFPVADIDLTTLSRSEEEVKAYAADPLNTVEKTTANVAKNFLENHDFVKAKFPVLKLPLVLLHGTADGLTNPKGSQLCYDLATSEDKTYLKYEGAYHEMLNEIPETKAKFIEDVVGWIVNHM